MSPPSVNRHLLKRQTFMDIAGTLAVLGTCDRKKVGAVIVRDGRCVSWGFNGAPPGLLHCDLTAHGWKTPVLDELERRHPGFKDIRPEHEDPREKEMYLEYLGLVEERILELGCRNATHAEANALAFAARQGISTDNSILFVTLSPCETCSRLLIAAGVREVFYKEEYRDRSGVELLERAGVLCERW